MVQTMKCESCGYHGEVYIDKFSMYEPRCPGCNRRDSLYECSNSNEESEEEITQ